MIILVTLLDMNSRATLIHIPTYSTLFLLPATELLLSFYKEVSFLPTRTDLPSTPLSLVLPICQQVCVADSQAWQLACASESLVMPVCALSVKMTSFSLECFSF